MVLGHSPDFFHLFGDIGECLLEALSNFTTVFFKFFYSFGDIGECCLEVYGIEIQIFNVRQN